MSISGLRPPLFRWSFLFLLPRKTLPPCKSFSSCCCFLLSIAAPDICMLLFVCLPYQREHSKAGTLTYSLFQKTWECFLPPPTLHGIAHFLLPLLILFPITVHFYWPAYEKQCLSGLNCLLTTPEGERFAMCSLTGHLCIFLDELLIHMPFTRRQILIFLPSSFPSAFFFLICSFFPPISLSSFSSPFSIPSFCLSHPSLPSPLCLLSFLRPCHVIQHGLYPCQDCTQAPWKLAELTATELQPWHFLLIVFSNGNFFFLHETNKTAT